MNHYFKSEELTKVTELQAIVCIASNFDIEVIFLKLWFCLFSNPRLLMDFNQILPTHLEGFPCACIFDVNVF